MGLQGRIVRCGSGSTYPGWLLVNLAFLIALNGNSRLVISSISQIRSHDVSVRAAKAMREHWNACCRGENVAIKY